MDETTLLNSTLSAFYTAGGGCLAIDAGKTLRADGQIVTARIEICSDSIHGRRADAYGKPGQHDLRYASGPGIWANGSSTFFDHLTVRNTVNCQPS
jgi:hypothetical protein